MLAAMPDVWSMSPTKRMSAARKIDEDFLSIEPFPRSDFSYLRCTPAANDLVSVAELLHVLNIKRVIVWGAT